jgi:hypothetical protein
MHYDSPILGFFRWPQGNVPGPDDGRTPVYITDAAKRVRAEALRKQLKTGGDGDWVAVDATGKPRESPIRLQQSLSHLTPPPPGSVIDILF